VIGSRHEDVAVVLDGTDDLVLGHYATAALKM
jgi:hypothetical protein